MPGGGAPWGGCPVLSRPGDREGERAFAKAEVVSITVTGKAGAAAPITNTVHFANNSTSGFGVVIGANGAMVNGSSKIVFNARLAMPEWLSKATGAGSTAKADVYVNGQFAEEVTISSLTGSAGDENFILAGTTTGTYYNPQNISVEITEILWDEVTVKFVGDNGAEVAGDDFAGSVYAGSTASAAMAAAGSGEALTFKYTSSVDGAQVTFTVDTTKGVKLDTGATGTSTLTTTKDTAAAASPTQKVLPDGTGFITVKVTGLKDLKEKVNVTVNGDADSESLTAAYNVPSNPLTNAETASLVITAKSAKINQGDPAVFGLKLTAACADGVRGYKVTIKIDDEHAAVTSDIVKDTTEVFVTIPNVTADLDLEKAMITVTPVEGLYVKSASWSGAVLTVVFSEAINPDGHTGSGDTGSASDCGTTTVVQPDGVTVVYTVFDNRAANAGYEGVWSPAGPVFDGIFTDPATYEAASDSQPVAHQKITILDGGTCSIAGQP